MFNVNYSKACICSVLVSVVYFFIRFTLLVKRVSIRVAFLENSGVLFASGVSSYYCVPNVSVYNYVATGQYIGQVVNEKEVADASGNGTNPLNGIHLYI